MTDVEIKKVDKILNMLNIDDNKIREIFSNLSFSDSHDSRRCSEEIEKIYEAFNELIFITSLYRR